MPSDTAQQCRHIRLSGQRCGSPTLRHGDFCFFHQTARNPGPRQPQAQASTTARRAATFDLPTPADLADRTGIQLAISLILHKIAHNEIDPRRAGLLLYGLQIATSALPKEPRQPLPKRPAPTPDPVEDLTQDALHGPLAPPADWENAQPQREGHRIVTGWVRAVEEAIAQGKEETRAEAEAAKAAKQTTAQAAAAAQAAATAAAEATANTAPNPNTPLNLHANATPTPRPNRAQRRLHAQHRRHLTPHP